MQPQFLARAGLAALGIGAVAVGVAFVAWPAGLALGVVAAALGAVVLWRRGVPIRRPAVGGLGLGLAAVALAAVVGVTGGGSGSKTDLAYVDGIATGTPDAAHPPQKDIQNPLPCRVEIGALRAGGVITNHTTTPADYVVIVVWEEDGRQLGRNSAVIANVAPSLTTNFEVAAPGDGSLRTTCRVERVDRRPTG